MHSSCNIVAAEPYGVQIMHSDGTIRRYLLAPLSCEILGYLKEGSWRVSKHGTSPTLHSLPRPRACRCCCGSIGQPTAYSYAGIHTIAGAPLALCAPLGATTVYGIASHEMLCRTSETMFKHQSALPPCRRRAAFLPASIRLRGLAPATWLSAYLLIILICPSLSRSPRAKMDYSQKCGFYKNCA